MSTDDAPGDPGWDDLDPETKHEILALADTINDDPEKVTRRDLLAGAGAVGTGMLLGGGASQALSEPAAASHNGGTIGTASEPMEMIHTEGLSSLESVSTESLNSIHLLDPDASDWGSAMNSLVSEASSGDTILVPSVPYTTDTKAVVDKHLSIVAFGGDMSIGDHHPTIEKTSDVTGLEIASGARVLVRGLMFDSNISDTTPAIEARHGGVFEEITGRGIGGPVVYLNQVAGESNLNNTRVGVTAREGDSDTVRVENTSGEEVNVNAMKIEVHNSFNQGGWAINMMDGVGNHLFVQNCEGSSHSGGIRVNGLRNFAKVHYSEMGSGIPTVQFDDAFNWGEIVYDGQSSGFVFNHNSNYAVDLGGTDTQIYRPSGTIQYNGDLQALEGLRVDYDGRGKWRMLPDTAGNLLLRNPSGATVAELTTSGDLILAGSITEGGSPG